MPDSSPAGPDPGRLGAAPAPGRICLLAPRLRPPPQLRALRDAGWRAQWLPVLAIEPIARLPRQSVAALAAPQPDTWLLVGGLAAAELLLRHLAAADLAPWGDRVAAAGEATAALLRKSGIPAQAPGGRGAAAALRECILPAGAKALMLATGHNPRRQVLLLAARHGVRCQTAHLYRRIPATPDARELAQALRGDWILATDPHSLRRLHRLAQERRLSPTAGVLTPWRRVADLARALGFAPVRALGDGGGDIAAQALAAAAPLA